jgi:hypothetical protein
MANINIHIEGGAEHSGGPSRLKNFSEPDSKLCPAWVAIDFESSNSSSNSGMLDEPH